MLNRLNIAAVSAIAVIMIAGCGKSSEPENGGHTADTLPKVSDTLKTLAKSSRMADASFDDLPTPPRVQQPQSINQTKDCLNGGAMAFVLMSTRQQSCKIQMISILR